MQSRRMRLYQSHDGVSYTLLWVRTVGIRVMWEARHLMKEDVSTIRKCNRRIYSILELGAGKWFLKTTKLPIVLVVSRKQVPVGQRSYRIIVGTGMRSAELRYRGYLQTRRLRYAQFAHFRPI